MHRHYNSDIRKLQLRSEMDWFGLHSFMGKNQVMGNTEGLTELVDHINALGPQLSNNFSDDPHKSRYLWCTVMRLELI